MGLHIDRRDGEAFVLDYMDGGRTILRRKGENLLCGVGTIHGGTKLAWRRKIEIGCTIGVDDDVSVLVLESTSGEAYLCFVVEAPDNVLISREEHIRTFDDRLREVMA